MLGNNFYPPALASGNRHIKYHSIYGNFYPPALASGNAEDVFIFKASIFLSTRSCERESKLVLVQTISPNFYPPALASGN